MAESKWHSGPPPHVGWWNASNCRHEDAWRWWNGFSWSLDASSKYPAEKACDMAARIDTYQLDIEWCDYYPKNARVPRINPEQS